LTFKAEKLLSHTPIIRALQSRGSVSSGKI
jgi:hypothetical protein